MKLFPSPRNPALTCLEVVTVLAALALVAVVTLPVVAGGKPRSDVAVCANNLRQLGSAALEYSMENEGLFPVRQLPNGWPQQLFTRYEELRVLRCPSDPRAATGINSFQFPADSAPRSYFINGWNDYWLSVLTNFSLSQIVGTAMPESAIPYPAQTVLFGEKVSESGHFYWDFVERVPGNDFDEVEHSRHFRRRTNSRSGGSNHTMADGSVRMFAYGEPFSPTILWAVIESWRTNGSGF